jgi:hypothetical protein
MIEVVSEPADLTSWKGSDPPYYLELFGETSPTIDSTFAEVLPPTATAAQSAAATPIYEYWWTIGHPGRRPEHHHLFQKPSSIWDNLDDEAAHVFMYFPINSGWRIKELVATIKYLSPIQDQETLSEKAGEDWKQIAPVLADAGSVSQMLSPIPVVGTGAAAAAPLLSALSKLQIGTVPSTAPGFNWYVDKVTTAGVAGRGVMQGVMWSIPKQMFESLGGRLTGSLAVSFIRSHQQGTKGTEPKPASLYGHAMVNSGGNQYRVPTASNAFVELELSPQLPAPGPAKPTSSEKATKATSSGAGAP